jgi:hypothetical protein
MIITENNRAGGVIVHDSDYERSGLGSQLSMGNNACLVSCSGCLCSLRLVFF